MRTHYGTWQPCWISNQDQKHKSGRGPSSEHFWQVWLISVQRFQRRRSKCEKPTDGRTLTHDKSSHGLWPGELKIYILSKNYVSKLFSCKQTCMFIHTRYVPNVEVYLFHIILSNYQVTILEYNIVQGPVFVDSPEVSRFGSRRHIYDSFSCN